VPILSEACCNLCLRSTATICSEILGAILDAHRENHARVILRMSEVESVKKRWLTVKSTVFYIEAMEAIHSLVVPRAHTFSSKDHGFFPGLAGVLVV
jgi:hypothetical protein